MPSDKHNSITAQAMGLIFFTVIYCFSGTCVFWHPAVHAMHFLMDLPVSSFVSLSSLLTTKGVDLAVAHDGFPLQLKPSIVFIVAT